MTNITKRLNQYGLKRRRYPNFETWCRFRSKTKNWDIHKRISSSKFGSYSLGKALWALDKKEHPLLRSKR